MADKQFDVSPEERRSFEEKLKQRKSMREYYIKNITNPHRNPEEGGHLFDPATFRYMAMRAKEYDSFRPTPKNGLYTFGLFVVPTILYIWALKNDRDTKEQMFRSGQVAYQDRKYKFF